ncbi:hypothetical protein [Carnobacterium maltaromaticum]|uniref:hypothetical protein n=1 Tax=Carnobacterium maltaromaticum TaxID=2751 RepID=UPI0039BE1725
MDEILTRYNVFHYLSENLSNFFSNKRLDSTESESNRRDLIAAIRSITLLLDGVEETSDERILNNEPLSMIYDNLVLILQRNIENCKSALFDIDSIENIEFHDLELLLEKIPKNKTWYATRQLLFNYLKQVNILSEKLFKFYQIDIELNLNSLQSDNFQDVDNFNLVLNNTVRHRAFLSYSYDDKFYTLGIFLIFLENGILLYVDWIFNAKKADIKQLKYDIDMIMFRCDYFIFLRTLNSELSIKGSRQIRQWCSWEIGRFYQYTTELRKEKFYIDTFDSEEQTNELLKDFSKLVKISDTGIDF